MIYFFRQIFPMKTSLWRYAELGVYDFSKMHYAVRDPFLDDTNNVV